MRLLDLEPTLYRFEGERSFAPVPTRGEADSVMFLCPQCFTDNGSPVGTHSIRIDFIGGKVPPDLAIHNSNGEPVYWNATGNDVRDLTLTPSIQVLHSCNWHGFVTNGEIV